MALPWGATTNSFFAQNPSLDLHDIVVRPAVNEDLGATARLGKPAGRPLSRRAGRWGLWHLVRQGPWRRPIGRRLQACQLRRRIPQGRCVGDLQATITAPNPPRSPPKAKFSFVDAEIPVFAPASIAEVLEFGVKAFDLSRYAGLWTAMTTVADVMDSAGSLSLDGAGFDIRFANQPRSTLRRPSYPRHRHPSSTKRSATASTVFPQPWPSSGSTGLTAFLFASPRARFGILAAGKGLRDKRARRSRTLE